MNLIQNRLALDGVAMTLLLSTMVLLGCTEPGQVALPQTEPRTPVPASPPPPHILVGPSDPPPIILKKPGASTQLQVKPSLAVPVSPAPQIQQPPAHAGVVPSEPAPIIRHPPAGSTTKVPAKPNLAVPASPLLTPKTNPVLPGISDRTSAKTMSPTAPAKALAASQPTKATVLKKVLRPDQEDAVKDAGRVRAP